MNTSPATSTLSKPTEETRIPDGTLAYFRGRYRFRMYELVVKEFLKSGLTQAALARRLGRRPEVVNRVLSAPSNLTVDTVSDFLFAISGAEPDCRLQYPLDQAPRNYVRPEWLSHSVTGTSRASMGEWKNTAPANTASVTIGSNTIGETITIASVTID